jgi:hypothetical protein
MSLGSPQPVIEKTITNFPRREGNKARPACKSDNFAVICELIFLENVETSTSHSLVGLHSLLKE